MDLTNGTIITVKEKRYIIIETLEHDNKTYAFTNEIKGEDELTEDYYIFRLSNNNINLIKTEEEINILLDKFREKLKNTIEEFL